MPSAIVFSDGATVLVAMDPSQAADHLRKGAEPSGLVRFGEGENATLVNAERVAFIRPLHYGEAPPAA